MGMEPDFLAGALELRAREAGSYPDNMARAVHAFFLGDVLGRTQPALAKMIHDEPDGANPFAVSGFMHPGKTSPIFGNITPDQAGWVRLVGLRRDVAGYLRDYLAARPAVIHIGGVHWAITATHTREHPWAGSTTREGLQKRAHQRPPPKKLRLYAASPLGFRQRGMGVPLPLPTLLFDSLQSRWNELGAYPVPDGFALFVRHCIAIQRFKGLQTHQLRFKYGYQTGFTGSVVYDVRPPDETLGKHNPLLHGRLAQRQGSYAQLAGMLGDFAFYAGAGIKTGMGMGMLSLISS